MVVKVAEARKEEVEVVPAVVEGELKEEGVEEAGEAGAEAEAEAGAEKEK
jgi:hypothetical protein